MPVGTDFTGAQADVTSTVTTGTATAKRQLVFGASRAQVAPESCLQAPSVATPARGPHSLTLPAQLEVDVALGSGSTPELLSLGSPVPVLVPDRAGDLSSPEKPGDTTFCSLEQWVCRPAGKPSTPGTPPVPTVPPGRVPTGIARTTANCQCDCEGSFSLRACVCGSAPGSGSPLGLGEHASAAKPSDTVLTPMARGSDGHACIEELTPELPASLPVGLVARDPELWDVARHFYGGRHWWWSEWQQWLEGAEGQYEESVFCPVDQGLLDEFQASPTGSLPLSSFQVLPWHHKWALVAALGPTWIHRVLQEWLGRDEHCGEFKFTC